jgi:hypothetical protein
VGVRSPPKQRFGSSRFSVNVKRPEIVSVLRERLSTMAVVVGVRGWERCEGAIA